MQPQAESAQFAAIWLLGDAPFAYQPHGATVNDPLLNIANPFSPSPTQAGQTYIVARPAKIPDDPYTTHSEKFIWMEVNTV